MPHVELPQAEFKVVLLGDTNTGKTSLVLRFVEGHYKDSRSATIGAFFLTKRLTMDKMTCKLLLWDTAGQEQFQKLAVTYYKQAAAAIVCFDVSGPINEQIPKLQGWLDQVQQNVPNRIVIFVAACKSDLPAAPGIEEQAKQLADKYSAHYIKTSAKNDTNVSEVFVKTAEHVLQCQQDAAAGRGRPIPVTVGGISLRNPARSFSPSGSGTPANSGSLRNISSAATKSKDDAENSSTEADSEDHVLEPMAKPEDAAAPKIMCDNGILVCGEGNGSECVIL